MGEGVVGERGRERIVRRLWGRAPSVAKYIFPANEYSLIHELDVMLPEVVLILTKLKKKIPL